MFFQAASPEQNKNLNSLLQHQHILTKEINIFIILNSMRRYNSVSLIFKNYNYRLVSFCIPFGIRVMLASLNELWSIFSSIFWRTLHRTVCLFFLRCLNSSVNLSGPRFSLWQSLTTFYFFNKLRAIQIIYFLHELCQFVSTRNLFHLSFQIISIYFYKRFPFSFCRIQNDVTSYS